jgi:hypothetical protein
VSESKRALALPSKSKNSRFPTEERKTITCYSAGSIRSSVSPRYTEAQHFTLHLPAGELRLSSTRTGIPGPPLSGNPTTLLVLGRPALHSAQRPRTPHGDCRRAPAPSSKSGNSSLLTEGRKEVIHNITRILQGTTYPAYPSLRNTARAPGEKKIKTPKTGAQGSKTLTKNNFRCINLKAE